MYMPFLTSRRHWLSEGPLLMELKGRGVSCLLVSAQKHGARRAASTACSIPSWLASHVLILVGARKTFQEWLEEPVNKKV